MYCKENYHLSLIAQRLGGSAWLEFRDLPKLDYYLAYIKCAPPIQYVAFADENLYELLGICTSLRSPVWQVPSFPGLQNLCRHSLEVSSRIGGERAS